jgi:hypothetical protein
MILSFMRKQFLLALIFICSLSSVVKALPGDTTWVQANQVQMDWYNNFDTLVSFPDQSKTYRKIYMIFTVGKYVCPGTPTYCGDWDYTVQTFFMAKNAPDTVELGRLITPYAHTGSYKFAATWTHRYIFDVTDYYKIMHDTATIRIHYSGYSGGFTGNVKFAFVEGTPERNVLGVHRLWKGNFNYGHGSTPINTALSLQSKTAPAGTISAELKMNITGHGGDDNACAEFCPNKYTVNLNSSPLAVQDFWRNDCAANELYPQTGTWIWSRANWCPGAVVNTISHNLDGVTGGNNYNLGLSFPAYTSTTIQPNTFAASYTIEAATIYYGSINKTLDASLEDIIAPNNAEYYWRENTNSLYPMIKVRNSGSASISSIKFKYNVSGVDTATYTWNGTLPSLKTVQINFPEFAGLRTVSGLHKFNVEILEVNGTTDADTLNNKMSSDFMAAAMLPAGLIMQLNANNQAQPTISGVCATSWRIIDGSGNIIKQKRNCPISTVCIDTVLLNFNAGYRLIVSDSNTFGYYDISQSAVTGSWHGDGLSSSFGTQNAGAFRLFRLDNHAQITLPGYYNTNFGSGFAFDFYTGWPVSVGNVAYDKSAFSAFPNPASGFVSIVVDGVVNSAGNVSIIDLLGRTLMTSSYDYGIKQIDINSLANGVYQVLYQNESNPNLRMQQKLVIKK